MKGIAIPAAVVAALALAGCNRLGSVGGAANVSTNAAADNTAVAKLADGAAANQAIAQTAGTGKLNEGGGAIPASSSDAVQLDRTYIMGRWADEEDCDKAIQFTQDGRFIAIDGSIGLWNLDGNRLTLSGRSTMVFRVVPIDQNVMTVVNAQGLSSRSTRC
jgi:hypothetical protein